MSEPTTPNTITRKEKSSVCSIRTDSFIQRYTSGRQFKKIKTKGIFHSDDRVRLPGAVPDKETLMVKLILVVIAFVGLLDYALLVASSMWDDEETYMRRHKDETD